MLRIKRQGLSYFTEMYSHRSVDVVQRVRLQTGDLQKNQIKKTAKTTHCRFRRPFLGQEIGTVCSLQCQVLRWKYAHSGRPDLPYCETLGF
jgi:hypothetical protein